MTRRRKKKTAEQIAAELLARRVQDLAAVGLPAEAAVLAAHNDVEVTRAGEVRQTHRRGPKVEADSARRLDAFEALREGMSAPAFAGAYDAARRLERDMTERRGEGDCGGSLDRVDCSSPRPVAYSIVEAGKRVDAVLAKLSARDGWLLTWLIETPINRFEHWRDVVAYITGETHTHAQGSAVRSACVNLRDAYAVIDGAGKRRAA